MEEYTKSNLKEGGQNLACGVEPKKAVNSRKLLFIIGVPSRSEPGVIRKVEVYSNGDMSCDCPARNSLLCWHKEKVLRLLEKLAADIKVKYSKTNENP